MINNDVNLSCHFMQVGGEPYWYYEYLIRKSPTKSVSTYIFGMKIHVPPLFITFIIQSVNFLQVLVLLKFYVLILITDIFSGTRTKSF